MTTSAWSQLEPCCNQCNDCGWGCKDKCNCNIVSANPECLRVDVEECGKIVLDPVCPPVVIAWENVTVEEIPCEEWEHCSVKYEVNAECIDEKVKVCSSDTAGFLADKFQAGDWISIDPICDGKNSKIKISATWTWWECEIPEIEIENTSELIQATVWWPQKHTIYIADRQKEYYDNNVCIWFEDNLFFPVRINGDGNQESAEYLKWKRSIYTGNSLMATKDWIKILQSGYYRVFWQLTVHNNPYANSPFYFNLWRGLLKISWNRFWTWLLWTAKHWAYAKQLLLTGWKWINVDADWVISVTWTTSKYVGEGWGNVQFWPNDFQPWGWVQPRGWFTWPWMTFNIDLYVDLYADEIIDLWYRWQSNMDSAKNQSTEFLVVWQRDSSSEYNALFGGTALWVQMITPKLFQKTTANKIYWNITN